MTSHQRGWLAAAAAATGLALVACMVNPVTGEKEFSLVSEAGELAMGAENYAPLQQAEGGRYTVDRELQAYVAGVGQRVAAVSDRPLPYEFVVLANPEANAWALPGGKIGVNLGLLWELQDEAELAAVLGHEITHAAARHGARAQTRSILLSGTLLLASLAAADLEYGDLLLGAGFVGAMLINSAYSREQELEADLYGTRYLAQAGYEPAAAVRLQETFLRLSKGRGADFASRLFASHPPSQERADKNRETAAALGVRGETRAADYGQRTARLKRTRRAYEDYGKAQKALREGQVEQAQTLARAALSSEPREPRFHGLAGDVAFQRKAWRDAARHYDEAIALDPDYYAPWLRRGLAHVRLDQPQRARVDLERSLALLPSSEAHLQLGRLDRQAGDIDAALAHFQVAAGADTRVGKQAQRELIRLDLPRRPGNYLQVALEFNAEGKPRVAIHNPTPVVVHDVRIRVAHEGLERTVVARGPIRPQETVRARIKLPGLAAANADAARLSIEAARLRD